VDAGGGTVDLSAYYMTLTPASFEEIAPAECESERAYLILNNMYDVNRSFARLGVCEPASSHVPRRSVFQ
jgi:hypothetical protein